MPPTPAPQEIPSQETPIDRARLALAGLSLGDSFGMELMWNIGLLDAKKLPVPPWSWTDDTEMACSIVAILRRHEKIDCDALADSFAKHHNPGRSYGSGMLNVYFPAVRNGTPWDVAAKSLFNGQGSMGNGAAMRVAPVGAFFAGNREAVIENARRSAMVTHAHPEGIAGAIAVALATAIATDARQIGPERVAAITPREFISDVRDHTPDSEVREKLGRAIDLGPDAPLARIIIELGNGSRITAPDTVPFVIWSASKYLDKFAVALWNTANAIGDLDTNCAMVGGIVASAVGAENIPPAWATSREPLPDWLPKD